MNFNRENTNKIIEEFYEMVKSGIPFLSWYPEEIVLGSIFTKYPYLFYNRDETNRLYIHEHYQNIDCARNNGYYFVQRAY